jgi:putative salt-induced outer membrane protein YdiY
MKYFRFMRWATVVAVAAAGAVSLPAQIGTNAPPPKPPPKWESTLTASMAMTRGNSKTLTLSGTGNTQKKWDRNEVKIGADGTYGEKTEGGTTTADPNNVHGFGQYNRLFGKEERLFGFGRLEAWHDEVAELDYRVPLTAGAGYYFIKKPGTDLALEAGPGFVWQKQGGVVDNYVTLRVGENFSHKFNDRTKMWQKTEWLPKLEDMDHYIISSEVGLSASLTKDNKLALTVTLNHTFNRTPAAGKCQNDTTLKTGISYAF